MSKLTKKQKTWTIDAEKLHGVDEAIGLAKTNATSKFDETIEVALNLGVDPRHADQMVRGVVTLPAGTQISWLRDQFLDFADALNLDALIEPWRPQSN